MGIYRRILIARGLVQGVGFRPFVYNQAVAHGLSGSVYNCPEGVHIELEGERAALDEFTRILLAEPPSLARIFELLVKEAEPRGETGFHIRSSETAGACSAFPPADVAPCKDCQRELFSPADRRYLYPFINCTACGPRYTIVNGLPYDRARTTMAAFALCTDCRAEYLDPRSRRFHAEPNACPRCGPTLYYESPFDTQSGDSSLVLKSASDSLRRGEILAIKSVGGFHLSCDAKNAAAVQRLRDRKRRAARPFALMAANLDEIRHYAHVSDREAQVLSSAMRPIVLLERRPLCPLPASITQGLRELGFMLPPSPLHQLLADVFAGPLIMTSGNVSDEPLAKDNDEARQRLGGIADSFLLHNRDIAIRIDDSVLRVEDGCERMLRRARGYVPEPLPFASPRPLLAVGADLKNTLCLVGSKQAFISQHLGDLHGKESRAAFREALSHLTALLGVQPEFVACDLHPDYASTRLAESLALPLLRVQHHHAHAAACLAEHAHFDPVIAVVFDGAGYGEDGAIWGGEFLIADRVRAVRAAHLRNVRLPGGDAAAREPWRMALSYLADSGEPLSLCHAPRPADIEPLARALTRGIASPWTSSVGRLFDAVSAMLGLCSMGQYEGQAAMLLEASSGDLDAPPYPFTTVLRRPLELDLRPTISAIARDLRTGRSVADIGARFHHTLAVLVAETASTLARAEGIGTVVLSGGCFQNARLAAACTSRLRDKGLAVLRPARFPTNDGGICLGQAAVAAARLKEQA